MIKNKVIAFIKRKKILRKIHNRCSSNSYSELLLAGSIYKQYYQEQPRSFLEIGANYFQDAIIMHHLFNIHANDIYVFEPNPEIFAEAVSQNPDFNAYNTALSNKEGTFRMQLAGNGSNNLGVSSMYERTSNCEWITNEQDVRICRLDRVFPANTCIPDIIKIDVEGHSYEVLCGFGELLESAKMIMLEAEQYEHYWKGQRYFFSDIYDFMKKNNF